MPVRFFRPVKLGVTGINIGYSQRIPVFFNKNRLYILFDYKSQVTNVKTKKNENNKTAALRYLAHFY